MRRILETRRNGGIGSFIMAQKSVNPRMRGNAEFDK